MPSIGRAIQDMAGKNTFLEHIEELITQGLASHGLNGLNTEIVFNIYKSDGMGVSVVIKNGSVITEPVQMGTVAEQAADHTKMFACQLARAR
ncbi:MAG: hypothetical protein WC657_00650 [Candidatus Paceibacterota bacterium]|jgi:hypothetical protein